MHSIGAYTHTHTHVNFILWQSILWIIDFSYIFRWWWGKLHFRIFWHSQIQVGAGRKKEPLILNDGTSLAHANNLWILNEGEWLFMAEKPTCPYHIRLYTCTIRAGQFVGSEKNRQNTYPNRILWVVSRKFAHYSILSLKSSLSIFTWSVKTFASKIHTWHRFKSIIHKLLLRSDRLDPRCKAELKTIRLRKKNYQNWSTR